MPTSLTGRPKHPALPAQWLYGLLRALTGVSGFLITVAAQISAFRPLGRNRKSAQLDPGVEGTGPRSLVVRAGCASSHAANASTATRLTCGDDWPKRPSSRGGISEI